LRDALEHGFGMLAVEGADPVVVERLSLDVGFFSCDIEGILELEAVLKLLDEVSIYQVKPVF